MTVSKAQGQTIYIPFFPHSQLHVAFSRTSLDDNVAVAVIEEHRRGIESDRWITRNVYRKCFKISNIHINRLLFIKYLLFYVRIIRLVTSSTEIWL